MVYSRPGIPKYATATKVVTHGAPCVEGTFAGVAVKQKEQSWTLGIANRNVVGIGEQFLIIHKGETEIDASLLPGAAVGDPVYIATADNTLSSTSGSGKVPFGKVTSLAGDNRGTPAGRLRIDMDARDSI